MVVNTKNKFKGVSFTRKPVNTDTKCPYYPVAAGIKTY